MAVLNKRWGSITETPQMQAAVVTGEDEGEEAVEAKPKVMNQPMMIYVTGGETVGFDKVEKVVLMDDKVCIGMWAFNCVKMSPESAKSDPRLEDTGDDVPRFIFISRDFKKVDTIGEKKMSAKNVYKAMKKHARAAYETKFDKSVKEMLDVLGDFDKITNQLKLLEAKQAREDDPSERDKKEFEEERTELQEQMKEAEKRRDELQKFEPKDIEI